MSLDSPKALSIDASPFSFGIVAAKFNADLVDALVNQVEHRLIAAGAKKRWIHTVRVPGSAELPIAARLLHRKHKVDCLIALGVLIRGDTIHYELIASSVTDALQALALDRLVPVINGVVVAETRAQAEQRCKGKINRGAEFASSAMEMAEVCHNLLKR